MRGGCQRNDVSRALTAGPEETRERCQGSEIGDGFGNQTDADKDLAQRRRVRQIVPGPVHDRSGAASPQAAIALLSGERRARRIAASAVVRQMSVGFSGDPRTVPPEVRTVGVAGRADPPLQLGRGESAPFDRGTADRFPRRLCVAVRTCQGPPCVPTAATRGALLVHRGEHRCTQPWILAHRGIRHRECRCRVSESRHVDARIDHGCQPDALHFLDHAIVVGAGVQPCSPHASRLGRVGTEHVHGIQRSDDRQPPQQCRGFPVDHGIRMPKEMRVDPREIAVPPGEAPPGGAVDVHAAGDGFHVSPPHAAGRVGQCGGGDQGQGRGAQGPKHGPRLWDPATASALFHSSGFGTGRMGRRGRHCPRRPKPHPADIPDAQR